MSPYPLLAALGLVWTWWGWKTGAFFGDVLIPGGIVLALILAALAIWAPWPARLTGPAKVALFSLAALAAWTLLSFLWTPAQEVAIADAERVAVYAISFVLGAWLCLLLGRDMELAAFPLVVAGGAVALATALTITFAGDPGRYFDLDGLLSYPLGYHNAVAAFFFICAVPAISLAASERFNWLVRGVLAGVVTLELGLLILTQSRGAAIAAVVGLAALVLLSRSRLGTLGWTAISVAPLLLVLPVLLDVYTAAGDGVENIAGEMHAAGGALLAVSLAAGAIGALVARNSFYLDPPPDVRRKIGLGVAAVAVLALVVPLGAVVARDGGPGQFLDRRFDEFSGGSQDFRDSGSRLGVNFGSDRGTLWAVAMDDGAENPVGGLGAGGFEYSFLAERESPDELTSEDPHGWFFLMLSELGVVGLALFLAFAGGAILACVRSRRLGPAAQSLSAVALAAFAYWLVQASVDWFWHYAGVTAPVAMLLGAAAAPGLRVLEEARLPLRTAYAVVATTAVLVVVQIPLFLSEHLLRSGIETGASDPTSAYEDLGLAADLNPWSPAPLIAEGEVAAAAGEDQRALGALSEASKRKGIDWTPHFLAAQVLSGTDPAQARAELAEARRLNPQGARIIEAEAVLDGSVDAPPDP